MNFNKELVIANKTSKLHKEKKIELHNTSVYMTLSLIRCLPMGGSVLTNLVLDYPGHNDSIRDLILVIK